MDYYALPTLYVAKFMSFKLYAKSIISLFLVKNYRADGDATIITKSDQILNTRWILVWMVSRLMELISPRFGKRVR